MTDSDIKLRRIIWRKFDKNQKNLLTLKDIYQNINNLGNLFSFLDIDKSALRLAFINAVNKFSEKDKRFIDQS